MVLEPDEKNVTKCTEKLGVFIRNGKAEVIPKGAWSDNTTLKFSSTLNGASVLSGFEESIIEIVTLDSVLADKRVTFTKMGI